MIDVRGFLEDNFKAPGGVVAFLRAYGAPDIPTEEAARKWFARGSLPGEWLGTLLAYLELDRGEPVSLVAYVRGNHAGQ